MRAVLVACAAVLASLSGCLTMHGRQEVPAVIVNPTAQSRASLRQAVGAAVQGAQVTLADDALTSVSTLLVERATRRDPAGLPLNGRELSPPERFRLVMSDEQCVLVHERSGARFTLAATACSPLR